ncbi:MAG TPA: hypothetical protein ENJ43_02830 [Gammaproteobacteria bacterium]|nr:hypothetical protein [Gammaproteobacteria bacterium]
MNMQATSKYIWTVLLATLLAAPVYAGGWDKEKGLDTVTLKGELICVGCSLKKLSGANSQCKLFGGHDVGLKLADGTFWNFVNNATGHDVIRAHGAVIGKTAIVTGWIYPNAHMIEIESIKVKGVTPDEIAKAAWEEDQKVARQLTERKVGEPPVPMGKDHKH